jgi:predicted transcriptional regulator
MRDIKEGDVGKYSLRVLQRCGLISPGVKRVDPSNVEGHTLYVTLSRTLLM